MKKLVILLCLFLLACGKEISFDEQKNAVIANDTVTLGKLLKSGANINLKENSGKTLMDYAIDNSNKESFDFLVKNGFDLSYESQTLGTLLHHSIWFGQRDTSNYLIEKGIDINKKGYLGITPLMLAVQTWDYDFIKYMIDRGAKVKDQADDEGTTTLHYLALKNQTEDNVKILDLLLKNGSLIDSKNKVGNTPLMLAIYRNNNVVAKELVLKGADINIPDNQYATPLVYAVRTENIEMVKFLIQKGAEKNISLYSGETLEEYVKEKSSNEIKRLF